MVVTRRPFHRDPSSARRPRDSTPIASHRQRAGHRTHGTAGGTPERSGSLPRGSALGSPAEQPTRDHHPHHRRLGHRPGDRADGPVTGPLKRIRPTRTAHSQCIAPRERSPSGSHLIVPDPRKGHARRLRVPPRMELSRGGLRRAPLVTVDRQAVAVRSARAGSTDARPRSSARAEADRGAPRRASQPTPGRQGHAQRSRRASAVSSSRSRARSRTARSLARS
jgi:hypothetical protein